MLQKFPVGVLVGTLVGVLVGFLVGTLVGFPVVEIVGDSDGDALGVQISSNGCCVE
jgi:hypothetical protein